MSSARGQFLPRDFALSFADRARSVSGVSDRDWAILEAGPKHEQYWDTWDDVLRDAVVLSDRGTRYRLDQQEDLWLVPEGMSWSEDAGVWSWPEEVCGEQ